MPPLDPLDPSAVRAVVADREAAAQAAALAQRVRAVPLPTGRLSGWSSLCAEEYGAAMRRLHDSVLAAGDALAAAGRA